MENKRDHSISMAKANWIVLLASIPLVTAQFILFIGLHGEVALNPSWGSVILIAVILLGIIGHELIHGLSWRLIANKPFSVIKFGFQWKSLTPYAHLKEPVEVNAYRVATFMPGFLLGIVPFILSLLFANGNLFWFGLVHTSSAGGDWLILWLIRNVKAGVQVEDHPTNAGCYVLEA